MPKHPLADAQHRERTGAAARIGKLAHDSAGEQQYPLGPANDNGTYAYLKRRGAGGLTIGRGSTTIRLNGAEVAKLIEVASELLNGGGKARLVAYPSASPAKARWAVPSG
jgi:hypothetical protein